MDLLHLINIFNLSRYFYGVAYELWPLYTCKHLDRYHEKFNGSKMRRYLMLITLYITAVSLTSTITFQEITNNFFVAFRVAASSAADIYLQLQSYVLLKQYRNDSRDVASYIDDRVLVLIRLYTASYFLCRHHWPLTITLILLKLITHGEIILLVIFFGQIFSNTDIIINSLLFMLIILLGDTLKVNYATHHKLLLLDS